MSHASKAADSNRRLKIVHAIFTRNFWGSERAAVELANHQAKRHDVTLMVRDDCDVNEGLSILDRADDDVRIIRIPSRFKSFHIVRHVLRINPDIFHSHLGRAARLSGIVLPWVRRVATLHVWSLKHYRRLDALICISPWQYDALPEPMRRRARVICNWVRRHRRLSDPEKSALREECGLSPDDYVVGFAGRLTTAKGVHNAVDGFHLAGLPDARLVIFGEGREKAWIEGFDDPDIRLMGYRANIMDYYQIMDVLLVPAPREPFGLTVVEAMDAGIRVIACRTTGPKDILEHEPDGLLFEPGNVEELAGRLREAHGLRGRSVGYDMARFDIDARVGDIEQLYRDLIDGNAVAPDFAAAHRPAS